MSEEEKKVYIIKRVKKIKKGGHHGGAWKIAYADFVTAMMTFFLLMWLLSLLNKYQIAGISEYFRRPLKAAFDHESYETTSDQSKEMPSKVEFNPETDQKMDGINYHPKKGEQLKLKQNKLKRDQQLTQQQLKQQQLQQMKETLEKNLEKNPELRQFKNQLNFIVTADGLKIELRDLKDKPMFSTGKADFEKYASKIVSWLSQQLATYPNQVVIIGHTDGAQYGGNEYTNWELSADRANATRRVLIKAGMPGQKIVRVIGVGDRDLLNTENPLDPSNRRIEMIVLSDDAMKKIGGHPTQGAPSPASQTSLPANAPTSAPGGKAATSVADPTTKTTSAAPSVSVPIPAINASPDTTSTVNPSTQAPITLAPPRLAPASQEMSKTAAAAIKTSSN